MFYMMHSHIAHFQSSLACWRQFGAHSVSGNSEQAKKLTRLAALNVVVITIID